MKFLKEYKFTIIFVICLIVVIALLMFAEISKENKKNDITEEPKQGEEVSNLIEPTKYQDIGDKYPIATITMEDDSVIKLKLYPNVAPNTVENFIYLANSGYYDGLKFHRILAGFMMQGGDPKGDGTGGPGYSIVGEFSSNGYKNDIKHEKGIISMARAKGKDTAGSQFFIMFDKDASLDGDYAAFGEVIEGIEVVEKLEKTEVYQEEGSYEKSTPVNPPVIKNIKVETFGIKYDEPQRIS